MAPAMLLMIVDGRKRQLVPVGVGTLKVTPSDYSDKRLRGVLGAIKSASTPPWSA